MLMLALLTGVTSQSHATDSSLWIAESEGAIKLLTTTGDVAFEIPVAGGIESLAVSPQDQIIWTFADKILRAYNTDGSLAQTIDISSVISNGKVRGLAVTSERIFLAIRKRLYIFDTSGALLFETQHDLRVKGISLDSTRNQLWLATLEQVLVYDNEGQVVHGMPMPNIDTVDEDGEQYRRLVYDAFLDQIWISLTDKRLRRYSPDGLMVFETTLEKNVLRKFLSPDGSGGLWASGGKKMGHISNDGQLEFSFKPFVDHDEPRLVDLVSDPEDQSVWVTNIDTIKRYSSAGLEELEIVPQLGDGIIRGINQFSIQADIPEPMVTIVNPVDGSVVDTGSPEIELEVEADSLNSNDIEIQIDSLITSVNCTVDDSVNPILASCVFLAPLTDAAHLMVVNILNSDGSVAANAESNFTVDTLEPLITIVSPAENAIVTTAQITIVGQLNEPASLTIAGTQVTLDATQQFDHPLILQAGANAIEMIAEDLAGNISNQTLNLTFEANSQPTISSQPVTAAQEGAPYSYALIAEDTDNDLLTYHLDQFPVGMSIDSSGLIQWPNPTVGTVAVTVRVEDGQGGLATQSYNILVAPNQAPVITSTPVILATIDAAYQYLVQANDPEGQAITYSLVAAPLGMSINSAALISWIPNNANAAPVTVAVTDSFGRATQQSYSIAVDYPSDNQPPQFTPIADQIVPLGTRKTLQLNAVDPEGEAIRYAITPIPAGVSFNRQTGFFSFEPESAAQVGTIALTFIASDGRYDISQTVNFTVTAPDPSTPTSFSGRITDANSMAQGIDTAIVGATVFFLDIGISAITDSDGSFTLDNIPTGIELVFAIDGSTANAAPGGAGYASFRELLRLIPNVENIEERAFFMPRIDNSSLTQVVPVQAAMVENQALGVALAVSANTAKNPDGSQFTGQISISEVPRDLAPAAMPEFLDPGLLITIQPAGLEFTTPAPITFPNTDDLPPGSELDIWSVNPTTGQFEIVGVGRVTSNGQSVETISGGIRRADWHAIVPRPPIDPENKDDPDNPGACPAKSASTTCLNDGKMTNSFSLPAYRSLETNRAWSFVYQTARADPQPILSITTGIEQLSTVPVNISAQLEIGGTPLEDGVKQGQEVFFDMANLEPGRNIVVGLSFDAGHLTSGMYRAKIKVFNQFEVSRIGASKIASTQIINEKNSSFGAGWMLDGLSKLAVTPPLQYSNAVTAESVLWIAPDGNHATYYSIFNTNRYSTPKGNFSTLVKNSNGTYTLTDKFGVDSEYSASGLMTARKDRNGNITTFTYGSNDQLERITDPVGLETSITYFAGRMQAITDPAGRTTQFSHDSAGNLTEVTYPDGSKRSYDYSGHLMVRKTDERGNVSEYQYDAFKRNVSVTLPDDSRRLIRNQSSVGLIDINSGHGTKDNPAAFVVDELSNAVYFDARGNKSTSTLDDHSRYLQSIDEVGRVTRYVRDGNSLAVSETRPNNSVINRSFDLKGNMLSSTEQFNGASSSYLYDPFSLITSITNPRNHQTLLNRDSANGNLLSSVNHLGHTTSYDYDSRGLITQMIDPNGLQTDYSYNSLGLLESKTETPPSGPGSLRTTSYSYNSAGLLESLITPDNITYSFTYDQRSRPLGYTDNLGQKMQVTYDDFGNIATMETLNADGTRALSSSNEYDQRNRLIETRAPHSLTEDSVVQYLLDPENNLTGTIDPKGNLNDSAYDASNRLARFTHRENGITDYQYDTLDRITLVRAPNGATTRFTYDLLGRRLSESSPDRGTLRYSYDLANNTTEMTDARGITATYSYDELERLTSKAFPNAMENITYSYDSCTLGLGYLCAIQDESGNYAYSYDAFGNVIQLDKQELGQNYSTQYGYDNGNNIIAMQYPSGRAINIQRDAVRRISGINATVNSSQQTLLSNIQYRSDNRVTQCTFGNGLVDSRQYDQQGRLQNQSLGLVDSRTYGYDRNGNILQRSSTPQLSQYQYDKLDRLTSDTIDSGIANNFSYDLNHNRQSKVLQDNSLQTAYQHDFDSNRLLAAEATIQGNDTLPSKPSTSRTYNDANRWFELYEEGTKKADYIYNSLGQRTRKTLYNPDASTASITIYHYDLNGKLITETSEAGQPQRDYIWANQTPAAQIDHSSTANQDSVNYLHTDHLLTPRLATNGGQQVIWRWEGEAFGETEANEDPDGDASLTKVNLRFPGQYFDGESGLHYNYFRTYDPNTGRYVQSDLIGLEGGPNTYTYVAGNPLLNTDPYGLFFFGPVCGSGASAKFIPDGRFTDACQKHDRCYGICGKSKEQCDLELCLNGACLYGFSLYSIFKNSSNKAYKEAQKESDCDGCNE